MARPEDPAARGQKEGQENREKKQKQKKRAQEGKGAGSSQGVSQEDWHLEGRQKKQTDKTTGNQRPPETRKGGHRPTPTQTKQANRKDKTGRAACPTTASQKSQKKNARATYLLRALLALSLSCSISVYRLRQLRCLFNNSFGPSPSSIFAILSAVIPHFARTCLLMSISCCTVIPTFAFFRESLLLLPLEGIWVPGFLF